MRDTPTNTDDIIDSRDIIARVRELERDMEDAAEDDDAESEVMEDGESIKVNSAFGADEYRELCALRELSDEAEGYDADWLHGACLIKEDYFPEYCQQLLSDIGDLPRDIPHYIVIDWEATAENLKADYTAVDFDGVTYLVR